MYLVKTVSHVNKRKEGEEEDYYTVALKDEDTGDKVSMKLGYEPDWKPGDQIEIMVKSKQLELITA